MTAILEHELESMHELEFEGAGELEGEFELEGEGEFEGEGELEQELNPVRKVYADAMMEHLAHLAAEAQTEQEAAEHFLPLVGLAAKKLLPVVAKAAAPALRKALPRIAQAVTRVEPRLTRGITGIARTLYRQPGTRRLLHAVPAIARRTVHSIARQAATGRPLTALNAIQTLARQTSRVLGHPHHRRRALRQSAWLDRRFHRHTGGGIARPHGGTWGPQPGGISAATGRYGPATGGRPSCPTCQSSGAASPAYCRCCGQILR